MSKILIILLTINMVLVALMPLALFADQIIAPQDTLVEYGNSTDTSPGSNSQPDLPDWAGSVDAVSPGNGSALPGGYDNGSGSGGLGTDGFGLDGPSETGGIGLGYGSGPDWLDSDTDRDGDGGIDWLGSGSGTASNPDRDGDGGIDWPGSDPDPDFEGIMPLALIDISPGVVGVENWNDLRAAISNTSIYEIRLMNNIQRSGGTGAGNNLPAISRTLTINGQGFYLDFRDAASPNTNIAVAFVLNSAPANTAFTLRDLAIVRPNSGAADGSSLIYSTAANSTNWTINLHNLRAGTPAPVAGLVWTPRAVAVNVSGITSWDVGTNNSTIIDAPIQNYYGADTVVTFSGGNDPINANVAGRRNALSVVGGAKVFIYSRGTGATQAINMQAGTGSGTTAFIIVDGPGSLLDVRGNGSGTGVSGGTITMTAQAYNVSNGTGGGGFQITNGATLNVLSLRSGNNVGMPCIVQQIDGGNFIVDGPGTLMNLESFGCNNNLGGTIRFRSVGNQTFTVTNQATVNITKHASGGSYSPAAVRFGTGARNSFYVTGGASVSIINYGQTGNYATPATSGADQNKAAVEFDANYFTFHVDGLYSNINLISTQGAAVAAGTRTYGTIYVGPGAIFLAEGNLNSNSQGIFSAGNNFSFECYSPLYYNFMNTNPRVGARVFDANGSNNTFTSSYSDVAVWGNGTSRVGGNANATNSSDNAVSGNPYRSWTLNTYQLKGTNFNTFVSSTDPTFNTTASSFGSQGMTPYRRISGNNANPIIQSLLPATNADLYVRATGVVPEGLNFAGRPIWTDEVYGRFGILPAGETTWQQSIAGQVTSINPDNIYTVQTDVASISGVVRYTNGSYLMPGDSYRVDSAWRGLVDNPSASVHLATSITNQVVTVTDILPPKPATVTMPSNGKFWINLISHITGTWSPAAEQAAFEPHNPDPAVRLYAVVNTPGNFMTDSTGAPIQGQLNANGTWSFDIPDNYSSTLREGDTIYFVLADAQGNANPLVDTPCHDTMLLAAPGLLVSQPDLILTHQDAWITLDQAEAIARMSPTAQNDALMATINAQATIRAGAPPMSTELRIRSITPAWDDPDFYLDKNTFYAENPNGKEYLLVYESIADPTIYRVAKITVGYQTAFIGAFDFEISVNNAIRLMTLPAIERDSQLITLAEAKGRLSLDADYLAANVEVYLIGIPARPISGESYDITFHVKGGPTD
ncbi:MAG: CDK5RAP3 family protein, partial [Coriobacteriia bacterium]|nr:CDK5RAP3 family protein [Coriobacteriia bacterium]